LIILPFVFLALGFFLLRFFESFLILLPLQPHNPTPQTRPYPLILGVLAVRNRNSCFRLLCFSCWNGLWISSMGAWFTPQQIDHLPHYLVNTNLDYPILFYHLNAGVHTTLRTLLLHPSPLLHTSASLGYSVLPLSSGNVNGKLAFTVVSFSTNAGAKRTHHPKTQGLLM